MVIFHSYVKLPEGKHHYLRRYLDPMGVYSIRKNHTTVVSSAEQVTTIHGFHADSRDPGGVWEPSTRYRHM